MALISTDYIIEQKEDADEPEVLIWGGELACYASQDAALYGASKASLRHESLKCGVRSIDCGQGHVLICTNDGRLLAYGNNDASQCGFPASEQSVVRTLTLIDFQEGARSVACGKSFSLVTTRSGILFGCGRREFLGQGPGRRKKDSPGTTLIPLGPFLQERCVAATSCAARDEYSCVSSGQDLWHFGYCRYLACSLKTPKPLHLVIDGSVRKISLGAFFGALLTESKVYVWGDGTYGEMGNHAHSHVPVELEDPLGEGVLDICCGNSHTLVVSRSGTLKVLGDNSNSQLGAESFGTRRALYSGKRVTDLTTVKTTCPFSGFPVAVYAGDMHSGMLTQKRRLYLWGSNTNGKLGQPVTAVKRHQEKTNLLNLCYRLLHRRIETVAMKSDATVLVCSPAEDDGEQSGEEAGASQGAKELKLNVIESARLLKTDFGTTRLVPYLVTDSQLTAPSLRGMRRHQSSDHLIFSGSGSTRSVHNHSSSHADDGTASNGTTFTTMRSLRSYAPPTSAPVVNAVVPQLAQWHALDPVEESGQKVAL